MKYPFHAHTRVALAASITDLNAPTVSELTAATDIACDLTQDGLDLSKSTGSVEVTRWASRFAARRPTRYEFSRPELVGFRFSPPDSEVLWDAAVFRAVKFLVVRRGLDVDAPWAAGQKVETYWFMFGKRTVAPSDADDLTTFSVPLFVLEDDDEAVVDDES